MQSSSRVAVRRKCDFGDKPQMQEVTRHMRAWTLLESLWHDVRYALRTMRRRPVFTTVAILSLSLGIGANTAIFTLINTLMLRMRPVREPEQLVELLQKDPGEPRGNGFWSRETYEHVR